jgi:hypothetical protein
LHTPKFIASDTYDIKNDSLFKPMDFSDTDPEEIGKLETLRGWNEPPDNEPELEKSTPIVT